MRERSRTPPPRNSGCSSSNVSKGALPPIKVTSNSSLRPTSQRPLSTLQHTSPKGGRAHAPFGMHIRKDPAAVATCETIAEAIRVSPSTRAVLPLPSTRTVSPSRQHHPPFDCQLQHREQEQHKPPGKPRGPLPAPLLALPLPLRHSEQALSSPRRSPRLLGPGAAWASPSLLPQVGPSQLQLRPAARPAHEVRIPLHTPLPPIHVPFRAEGAAAFSLGTQSSSAPRPPPIHKISRSPRPCRSVAASGAHPRTAYTAVAAPAQLIHAGAHFTPTATIPLTPATDLSEMASVFWSGLHHAFSPQTLDAQWSAIKQAVVAGC